ncbi:MAG: glycine cleavage system aminomethyltransferase GcvT [Phycisphaerae bacterium]|nr:glycine cleavage system aminomethyltransferase GcvT [Phycisphaerae bacterium]
MGHKTPLHQYHLDAGAKMVDFAGWEMPIVYGPPAGTSSLTDEHHQVRRSGGMFDVSHMGRVKVTGRHARRLLERLCTRRIHDMKAGQCRYSLVLNERGGIMDDVIVYRYDEDDFLVVVNASNREKLLPHFAAVAQRGGLAVKVDDQTLSTAMVALQGPKVIPFVSNFSKEIPSLKRYTFAVKNLLVMKLVVSRTGYTGEDGVEVILPASMVGMAMKLLLKDVDPAKPDALVKPAGLGARDTLRTEAGMPLYGHELTEDTNALATSLDFAIAIDKDQDPDSKGEAYIGMEAIKRTRDAGGTPETLVGIACKESKRSPRQGMAVLMNDRPAGKVTSGCPSPTLGYPIAMAYVGRQLAQEGAAVEIDTGRDRIPGVITKLPFYKAPKPS